MKYYFFAFLLFTISTNVKSQESETEKTIASLKQKIATSQKAEKLQWMDSLSNVIAFDTPFEDDSLVKATSQFAISLDSFNIAIHHTANQIYYLTNIKGTPEEAKKLYLSTRKYLPRVTLAEAKCKFYYDAGNTYFYLRDFSTALQLYDSIQYLSSQTKTGKYLGLSKMAKGQVYTDMGDFGKASLELQDAIRYYQTNKDTLGLVGARNSLVILYSKNRFFKEAKQERDQLIAISLKQEDYNSLPALYYNAAADQRKTKDIKARIRYLNQALEATYKSKYKEYYEPIMLSGLVLAYSEADSLSKAQEFLKIIEANKEKNTTGPYRTYYLEAIKAVELLKKNYANAIQYGEEYLSLMKEGKQYEEIEFGEYFLYQAYETIGNQSKAFQHYKAYNNLKDSIGDSQKVRVLSYYQTLYETEKRDLTIKAQETNIALLDEKNKVKNQWLLFGGMGFLSLFGFVWVLRSRNFAKRRQKLQENFTQDILKTQENERARIASELHDSVGQKLLMIKNSLVSKETEDKNEIDLVGETIKEVREMSHNLHPFQFEKLGLITSLKNMVETFQKNSNVFYSEDIEIQDGLITKENEIYVFRMLQEAMTNVEKHSQATACSLTSKETKNYLVFTLKDNGKGFKADSIKTNEGLGMKTLKERAQYIGATLDIESVPEKGSSVTIKIPKK
ncbi:sensor histidine kinase [Aureisphaera sp. CAU 1614]|uniref:histidine kinase n=1 Tax=Halomarinibacterium sedimenti TaxID=2857106 RepID=A0A9X1JVE3_9FLAO|nr:sensor histidine kinase [Halomarinibacterium sedimenti]MBW2937640.1 sensor histidine kinase [Halomarinibacterium sedimenti]